MPETPVPIIVLSSGGKDSMFMLDCLQRDPEWDVRALVTTVNESNGRVAMHGTPGELLAEQAESLSLPLTVIGLPENCDNAEYERRLQDGLRPFEEGGIEWIACGDLFLGDIRRWREALFERIGWQPVFPLWEMDTSRLAESLASGDWGLTITCVDTEYLSTDFLGCRFSRELLDELPDGVDPCGENGEFHTFVHAAPGFSRPIQFTTGRVVMTHGRFAMLELLPEG